MFAGTCDICDAQKHGRATHSDTDCSELAKTMVGAVRDLNARNVYEDLDAALQVARVCCSHILHPHNVKAPGASGACVHSAWLLSKQPNLRVSRDEASDLSRPLLSTKEFLM
jgi:hypothetical protein